MMDRAALRLILLGVFLISASSQQPVKKKQNVDIYSFYINSTVTSRYATTVITSRVANTVNESQEIQFEVKIPKNAFISKFRMSIEGKIYDGVVKEKQEAQQQYSRAVSRGESAGLIKSVGRTLEDFKTSVTVAAFSKVTFELTYEELLKRRLGKYELLINTQPMQPVADFKIDIHIQEKPGISFLEVKGDLSTGDLANAIKTTRADKDAWVTFYPTRDQQTKCKSCGENGLNGDLLITYDVDRSNHTGEVMVSNGYFVHYFAPSDVPRIPKNVVFIIDRSGSMNGRKIQQTRLALLKILGDLNEDDHFGLITFDSEINTWKNELLKATEENLEIAKSFVKEIRERGATDINAAVLAGVDMINRHPREGTASILILLTDGDPTSGETNKERIMANVKEAIGLKFPLYCLGFGYDVNFDFLTQMSLENAGLARRIYEDSDADLQLQGFYDEVAVPLLSDIQLKYTGGTNLTKTSFSLYFNGSEIVVSGQITDNSVESFTSEVIAVSKGNNVTYQETVMVIDPSDALHENEDFMPRLWAYLTVKQILERQVLLKGQEKEDEKEEALKLSLKYQFVTSLTSMVVTKPQEDEVEVADKPKEGGEEPRPPVMSLLPSSWNPVAVPGFSQYVHSPGQPAPGVLSHPSPGFFMQSGPGFISQSGSFISEPGPGIIRQSGPGFISQSLPGQSDKLLKLHPPPPIPGIYDSSHDYSGLLVPDQVLTLQESAAEEIVLATLSDQMPTPLQDSTEIVVLTMPVPRVGINRFLLSAAGQSKPLCFDVPAPQKLRLLQDSASEFSMNGQFMTGRQGFFQIAFHYKTNHHLTINTSSIRYEDGQNHLEFLWDQEPTQHNTEGVSLILRRNEMDVTMGSIRVVILLHKEKGEVFLWPAVRQQPKDVSLRAILGKAEASYEEVQGSQTPTLKIMDQEVKASLEDVTDYTLPSTPVIRCWLVPFQAVMQGDISDFTVTQL
ncbi:inter-alpha-trypsin inhibitor heavy chain H3-like isoform X1 [Pimephales promelas]|uniref:inter-alpha-trypsin inhibitor heavy chain H3-like isoform X1 n=1 Tax=Pimephales promelas TaxID=90988 RepID=UPI0019557743|nr:inter-alpha-trypsin inhibitor heavy chain H3-like isoform X1 [Pimephales promelas]